ncbi:MAG: universal stress protein [Gelidibacter sp.]
MKKIIVPVDFSKHSEYALEAAAIIAKKYGAELLALHMLELSSVHAYGSESENEHLGKAIFYIKLAEKKFSEFLKQDFLNGVSITPIVRHFKVFAELSEVAKEHDVDLIVMGSKGTSGLNEFFVGSNTERVVRHSDIPVLVIKNKPTNLSFDRVVFASDFSEEAVKPYIKASKFLGQMGSNLQLLYVNVPGESFKTSTEMEEKLNQFLLKANGNLNKLNDVHYVADTSVEKGILNFARKINADLTVIPTHGRTGLAHFFEGSISEDLANHSNRPVMTFKIG